MLITILGTVDFINSLETKEKFWWFFFNNGWNFDCYFTHSSTGPNGKPNLQLRNNNAINLVCRALGLDQLWAVREAVNIPVIWKLLCISNWETQGLHYSIKTLKSLFGFHRIMLFWWVNVATQYQTQYHHWWVTGLKAKAGEIVQLLRAIFTGKLIHISTTQSFWNSRTV